MDETSSSSKKSKAAFGSPPAGLYNSQASSKRVYSQRSGLHNVEVTHAEGGDAVEDVVFGAEKYIMAVIKFCDSSFFSNS